MTLTDAQLAQFARLKSEVLDAIVDLVSRTPDDYWVHAAAMLRLAEANGLRGSINQELHHDGAGRVNSVKHAPKWETLRARRTA